MYNISQKGIDLICEFEGCELTAYQCPAGIWTIGYGSTGKHVYPGKVITQKEAELLLKQDLVRFEHAVNELVKVPITQYIYDALVSLTYNIGEGALADSTVLRLLNSKDYAGALDAFLMWNKANGESLPGLTKRRKEERRLAYSQKFPR